MESGELITAMEAVRRVLILENPERPGTSSPSFTSRLVSQPEHRQRVKTVSVVIGRTLTLLQEVPAQLRADFPHRGNGVVEKVRYEAPKDQLPGRVWINATQSFEGIEPETWTFLVGGYQVCEISWRSSHAPAHS